MTIQTTTSPLATGAAQADTRAMLLQRGLGGAIFAGAVTALVTQVIVNLVGVGVGLASVGTTAADTPSAATASMGAGLWFVASGIVACWPAASSPAGCRASRCRGSRRPARAGLLGGDHAGGALPAHLGGRRPRRRHVEHGVEDAGRGGLLVGGTVQTAAQAAAPSLSKISNPLDGIEQRVREQSAGQDPQAARDAAVAAVRAVLTGDAAQKEQAKSRAADALARAQGISADQAKAQIDDYQKQYEQAVATAKQKAEAAAVTAKSAATQGAFYAALALLLGGLAAFLGGRLGAPKPVTLLGAYETRRA